MVLVTVTALILLVFVMVWIVPGEKVETPQAPRAAPVAAMKVGTRTFRETVRGIGSLESPSEVEISAEVAGRVSSLRFQEGSAVEQGQVLVELNAAKARSQLVAREAALQSANVQLANLQRTFERQQKLVEQGLVSEEEFEEVRTERNSARAAVEQAEAELALTREQLEDTTVRAPFAGTISEKLVDEGAIVSPGDPLAHLYRLDPLEFSFSVPERFSGRLAVGQPVSVTTAAYPEQSFPGEVTFVSPSISEETRTLAVKATVPNPERKLKPGAFATGLVTVGKRENRPVVPAEALVAIRSGYMVFVVEDGRARSREISVGLRRDGVVEITEGLQPGETIVRSGHMRVNPGMPVKIVSESELRSESETP